MINGAAIFRRALGTIGLHQITLWPATLIILCIAVAVRSAKKTRTVTR